MEFKVRMIDTSLDDGYKAMATDHERENEASEWCNAITGDMININEAQRQRGNPKRALQLLDELDQMNL
ncbi:hypothetical protein [Crenothrix sp.]|uniref:hypothetical protein n=1 Tax=Crenothrix sp. TaxID=3100433 RepID=UPI00374CCABD